TSRRPAKAGGISRRRSVGARRRSVSRGDGSSSADDGLYPWMTNRRRGTIARRLEMQVVVAKRSSVAAGGKPPSRDDGPSSGDTGRRRGTTVRRRETMGRRLETTEWRRGRRDQKRRGARRARPPLHGITRRD